MNRLWALAGALVLLNLAIAAVVFVAPGFGSARDPETATTSRLPGVIETLEPRAQPFWFIRVPRPSQGTSRRDGQVTEAAANAPATAPLHTGVDSRASNAGDTAGAVIPPVADGIHQPPAAVPGTSSALPASSTARAPQRATVSALITPLGLYPAGYQGAGMALLSFVTFLALACATAFIVPDRIRRVREAVSTSPRRLLILATLGVLTLAMAGLVVQALFLLVVSVVLTPIVAGLAAACVLFGLVAMFLVVGTGLRTRLRLGPASPLADLVIGMLVVFPLTLIPAVGWVVLGLLMITGTGAVIATRFGGSTGWSLASLSEDAL